MTFYNVIEEIDIEHSSICNAACPQCTREFTPGDYSWINQTWLPNEFYSERIPQHVYDTLKNIYFSGMVGDPCTAPNFLEVVRIIREKAPHVHITVSTNGGMKNTKFWAELAEIFGEKGTVKFAIDGLEDTNHIYRVNVKWDKVIANVKAYRNAGGRADWQYIVFKHNEHQVEEAEAFAKSLGFEHFIFKRSNKFLVDDLFELTNQGGSGIKIEHPTQEQYVHPLIFQRDRVSRVKEALNITEGSPIACEAQQRKTCYVSADGWFFPCVYTATSVHLYKFKPLPDKFMELWNEHGGDKVNLLKTEWNEVVNGEFLTKMAEGWSKSYTDGKIAACGLFCSKSSARIFDPCVVKEIDNV
jgi:MoaA/NifB/PqqE/SkfB family radical SAM enzyme